MEYHLILKQVLGIVYAYQLQALLILIRRRWRYTILLRCEWLFGYQNIYNCRGSSASVSLDA